MERKTATRKKTEWTKKLITQSFTDRGSFRTYLKKYKKIETGDCIFSAEQQPIAHLYYSREKWKDDIREVANKEVIEEIRIMLESQADWETINHIATVIIQNKIRNGA